MPAIGDVIAGKYRLDRVLGRGGMGIVFEATHLQLDRAVAIKFLLAEAAELEGASARFLREARAAARLKSDHVVRVLDVDVAADGAPYMVMELLQGCDLHRRVREGGPLSIETAIDYVLQVCDALVEAHAIGIVHRDLKPGNLFLTRKNDGSALVKLLDFGIAKATGAWSRAEQGEPTRGLLGSPLYMSPEQLRDTSAVDARTDIWSLGVILHELVTGRCPFEAPSEAALGAMIVLESPALLRAHFPGAPEALERVIARCLEKKPQARFADVAELADALRPFVGDASRLSVDRMLTVSSPTVLAKAFSDPPPPPSSLARSGVRTSTDNFRRQHEELAVLGGEIFSAIADPEQVAKEPMQVRRLVARFAGKLRVHASMENEALYPRLMQHHDPAVREKAVALYEEVETIYASFAAFSAKWPTAQSIVDDPIAYTKDTRRALKTLWMRMMRENDELYPLVDAAEPVTTATGSVRRST